MDLPRIGRKYAKITATATNADGASVTLTTVQVALLEPRTNPTADTVWTEAEAVGGKWRVLLAGPDAAGEGALVVPADGADLWIKVSDNPEIDAQKVERLSVA